MNEPIRKRHLFRWIGWFFLISSIILLLIQLSFLKYMPNLHQVNGATTGNLTFAYVFLFTSYITQASLLIFACALLTLLLTAIIPKRTLTFCLGIFSTSLLIMVQTFDAIVYGLYQSHEIGVGIEVLKTGAFRQVIPMSFRETLVLIAIAILTLIVQSLIALWVWRRVKRDNARRAGIWVSAFIVACFCFSYGMMAGVLSLPKQYQINDVAGLLLLKTSRLVPYYPNLFEFVMPLENPYERTIETQSGSSLTYQTQQSPKPMHYPLNPLRCTPEKSLPNILFIVIDSWRFDALNKTTSPNIDRFARKTLQFNDHWSGGNCTETGIFSLFYGLPANYWHTTIVNKQGPIFIKALQKNNYQLAIYASATLKFPTFNKNLFVDVKNLKTETNGLTTVDRDKRITVEFNQFLKTRNKTRPFCGFVFYDSAHNYCDGGTRELQTPFQPAIKTCARFSLTKNSDPTPYLNRYRNAVYFIDQEIQKIFNTLKQEGLYKNTIIIITSDHGEQFNDEKLGYWSHNSSYSSHQLQVPMLIYWPGKRARVISYFSTHFDVVPTLMQKVFHCRNPIKDYSTGQTLFEPNRATYTLSASYTNYAVLLRKRHTAFYPNGAYAIKTPVSQQIPYATLDTKIIKQANQDLNRYFH